MQNKQDDTQIQPLVSFIVTYYEFPFQLLCECIESILALSLRPYEREIIVIDDGSSTSPLPHLQQYDKDIVYIRTANGGLSMARNVGIRMARGQFLQFIDGDDTLLQAPYEHCLDIARYGKNDMIVFDFTDTDEKQCAFNDTSAISGTDYMRHINIKGTACCYLFKRSILGELKFTPGIYHEDEEFTPQLLLRAENVITTDAHAYFYRRRTDSITNATDARKVLKRLNDTKYVLESLKTKASTLPTEERAALQRRVAQLTMDYIYTIILQTQNRHFLNRKLEELRREGLFPLPDHNYTLKYQWFRRLSNTSVGLSILMRTLPLMNKER